MSIDYSLRILLFSLFLFGSGFAADDHYSRCKNAAAISIEADSRPSFDLVKIPLEQSCRVVLDPYHSLTVRRPLRCQLSKSSSTSGRSEGYLDIAISFAPSDAPWAVPIAATTGILLARDRSIM